MCSHAKVKGHVYVENYFCRVPSRQRGVHSHRDPKAEFILERKRFFFFFLIALSHAHFRFLRSSVLPIDRYQNATSKAISQHELKTVQLQERYTLVTQDSIGRLKTENAQLHERFIASSGFGVWMKTLQFIAKR